MLAAAVAAVVVVVVAVVADNVEIVIAAVVVDIEIVMLWDKNYGYADDFLVLDDVVAVDVGFAVVAEAGVWVGLGFGFGVVDMALRHFGHSV